MRARHSAALLLVGATVLSGCAHGAKAVSLASTTHTTATTPTTSASATASTPVACPLTGTPASAAAADRTALAVKIDNVGPARPQSGLNNADIVVEEQVEGGLTRLFAVFACHTAGSIGPIRSARTTDADLLALLHGSVFAFSGANPKVLPPIRARGDAAMLSNDADPRWFHRSSSRPAPHNVYSSSATLLAGGASMRKPAGAAHAWFSYGAADALARPAHAVTLHWPAASAGWTWNGTGWVRTQNGTSDVLSDGSRVSATNVVILGVKLTATGIRDVDGNPSPDDVVTGGGAAWVLRGGTMVTGRWSRASVSAPWTLTDSAGHVIDLAPGRTWVELEAQTSTIHVS